MATKRRWPGAVPTTPNPLPYPVKPVPLTSLVASATRLTSAKIKESPGRARKAQAWQTDAWEMYDLVGEQRFLASTLANRLSQARLYVGHLTDSSTSAPETVEDPAIAHLIDSVGGSPAGLAQLIDRLGKNLFIAGDAWVVGIPHHLLPGGPPSSPEDDGLNLSDLDWRTLSVAEVTGDADGTVTLRIGEGQDEKLQVSPDEVLMIRVWRPHPARSWEADSPTRSSLPVLRELVGLTMHISAQIDSRLAGAGLLIVPQSAQRAFRIAAGLTADPGPDEDATDPFTEALIEAMLTPIGDRANASALVPLIVTVPDEVTGNFEHMTFAKPLDTEARSLRDEAIRRLALGQDAPPELLLGTGGMNHWGAWLVREDVVTTHLEPPLALICDALTTQYLWPMLEEQGLEEEEAREYVVWYDVSHMITRPNRVSDAQALYDRSALSDMALRAAAGFDEADAPDLSDSGKELDPAVTAAFEMMKGAPGAVLAAPGGLVGLVEQIRQVLEGAPSPSAVPVEDAAESERAPEPGDNPLPSTSDADADLT